ncbi:Kelch repeat-containing protein [Paenibacillus assamensis]|uniref:Kelch repeat-containing protein n=1 Tax=Paenibacillus assamensis TaxID=311244 RepID=UPI00146E1D10|nr:kelch motif-containing protein [Paenibacillus assamensis]
MSLARGGSGVATVNGVIYTLGGVGSQFDGTVESYDPKSDKWSVNKKSMPTPRAYFGTATVGGKIYTFGGQSAVEAASAKVEVYDTATDTWTAKKDMPYARVWTSSIELNGKIYVVGGSNNSNLVQEYDPVNDIWTTKASLPRGRHAVSLAVVGEKMYAIGGGEAKPNYNDLQEYDPKSDTWTVKNGMPTPRDTTASVVYDGKIYVLGGLMNSGLNGIKTVEIYDPATDSWSTGPEMINARWAFGAGVVDGTIYAIGGHELSHTHTPTTEKLVLSKSVPPEVPGNHSKGLLTLYLMNGQVKEYDLTIQQLNAFLTWYDARATGIGSERYGFVKTWHLGPFKARTEYVAFDKIVNFDIDEY